MSSLDRSYVLTLLSDLGTRGGHGTPHGFTRGVDCLKTLKRLRKEVHNLHDRVYATQVLLETKAIREHVIPLILECVDDDDIILESTKLLVSLTKRTEDEAVDRVVDAHAAELRRMFTERPEALTMILGLTENALQVDASKRSEQEKLSVELVFWLVRNLVHTSENAIVNGGTRASGERFEFISVLGRDAAFDIVLHFTEFVTRQNNREWNLLFLEIYFELFRGVSPDDLVSVVLPANVPAVAASATSPHPRDLITPPPMAKKETILSIALRDLQAKRRSKTMTTTHSRFGGAVQILSEPGVGVGSKVVSSAVGISGMGQGDFKNDAKPSGARRRVQDTSAVSRSMLNFPMRVPKNSLQVLKSIADSFVERGYLPLFTSVKEDLRREDLRITPQDEIRYIWLLRFFTRYIRATTEGKEFDLEKSCLGTSTMDQWSFGFVVDRIVQHMNAKAWASLETDVSAMLEMILLMKRSVNAPSKGMEENYGKALQNAIFYELREPMEIIPKLLKMWDPIVLSRSSLRDLATLGNAILETLEDMSREGAMAKAKARREKKDAKSSLAVVQGSEWSAEETFALVEGVKNATVNGKDCDLKVARTILKNEGTMFEDQKRTPSQLVARWGLVKEALMVGKTLEVFMEEETAKTGDGRKANNDDEDEDDEKVRRIRGEEEGEEYVREKQIDFLAAVRTYLSNNIYRNIARMMDPAFSTDSKSSSLGGNSIVCDIEGQKIATKFYRRLRGFRRGLRAEESFEPILWHIENFDSWNRTLSALSPALKKPKCPESVSDLVRVLESSLRRFFRHAQKSPLIYTEVLFWRTKAENMSISRFYVDRETHVKKRTVEHVEEVGEDEEEEANFAPDGGEEEEYMGGGEEDEDGLDMKKTTKILAVASSAVAPVQSKIALKIAAKKEKKALKTKLAAKAASTSAGVEYLKKVDCEKLSRAVGAAFSSGVTAESLLAVVEALETASGSPLYQLVDYPLVSLDESFLKPAMWRVLLLLGARPRKRDVATRQKDWFACEHYWRIMSTRMTSSTLTSFAEALRESVISSDSMTGGGDFDDDDLNWCASDLEQDEEDLGEELDNRGDDEDSNSGEMDDDSDKEEQKLRRPAIPRTAPSQLEKEEDEDTEMTAATTTTDEMVVLVSKKRRIVVESDEDD